MFSEQKKPTRPRGNDDKTRDERERSNDTQVERDEKNRGETAGAGKCGAKKLGKRH